jgi:hypothetical protein
LLGAGQMLNANAGNSGKTQLLGRLDANHPIQDGKPSSAIEAATSRI